MPSFSQASLDKLFDVHVDLRTLFLEVIKYVDCTIVCGYRNKEAQDKAFSEGNSKLRWPNGQHNKKPSMAVDVAPYPLPAWSKTVDFIYFGGYVMGIAQMLYEQGKISHKIRYGGDFSMNNRVSDEKFLDTVHFELRR